MTPREYARHQNPEAHECLLDALGGIYAMFPTLNPGIRRKTRSETIEGLKRQIRFAQDLAGRLRTTGNHKEYRKLNHKITNLTNELTKLREANTRQKLKGVINAN